MIATVNQAIAIPMYFTDAAGVGKTGLTVTATARLAGSTTTAAVTVTERGSGSYDAAFVPTATGIWQFLATTTIDGDPAAWTETVQAVTAAQFDPAAYLSGSALTIAAAVSTDGATVTVYQGDDHAAVESRALTWARSDWPALAGATITLTVASGEVVALTKVGGASGSVPGQVVSVDLTRAETAALSPATAYRYDLSATLGNGHVVTLARGALAVIADVP